MTDADYSNWADYFWPDTPGVLRNKLGVRDPAVLSFIEAQLTAVRIAQYVLEPPTGKKDYAYYCETHRRLFTDVYDWAGQPRTTPEGPMIKKGRDVVGFLTTDPTAPMVSYRYRPGPQVRDNAEYLFDRLDAEDSLTGLGQREFVERLGKYWGAIDSVHPFREGNTRTEVTFFHQLARDAGYDLGAGQLHARHSELVAARWHGHATGGYHRLTALLASTVEMRDTQQLTPREHQWTHTLADQARHAVALANHTPPKVQHDGGLEL